MKQDSIRAGIITLAVAVFLFGLVAMVKETDTPKCMEAGCDNEPASGSSYCYLHKPYPSTIWGSTRDSGYSSILSSTGSSTSSSGTSSSTGISTSSSTSTKSAVTNRNATSSSKTSKKSSTSSYDEGYDDVYENEDYDLDRYYEDDDYASGVDDAMEDEDW